MKELTWEEVKARLRQNGNLAGCLYLDGDEVVPVSASESIVDIIEHHERGGGFAEP